MNQFKYIIFGSLLFTACAQGPVRATPPHPADAADSRSEDAPPLPNIELSDELLYEFLLTEIATQRGDVELAVQGSSDLARKTHDPRLAMRAAQLALQTGRLDKAIEALKIWREVDPASPMAMRMYASALLRIGRLDEARQELASVLKAEPANAAHIFYQIYQMLVSYPDKEAALRFMLELAQPYPRVAEAHWAVAQLAQASGDEKLALDEARLARSLRPEWDTAVSLEAFLLKKSAPQQGLDLLRRYLSDYPDAQEIRLQYARALLEQKQYKEARNQFQYLADQNPDNPETAFAIALISLQLKDFKGAEDHLKQALSKGRKDQNTVRYYLGQLGEAKQNNDEAIEHYRQVKGGEYQFAAQIRIAYLLNKSGRFDEAIQQLRQIQPADNQQRVQLISVEAQFLRESNRLTEAYLVMQHGLEKLPNDPDLLYGTAMLADMLGQPEVFEQLMRKLIKLQPDHAHAYNALGYGLLERNERIPEAMQLVEKALQLAPDDPAIMDSVGWGYYRSGKLDESVKMLRRAFTGSPDPEIAAHLGEVLWMRGDKAEARKIWQDSLKDNPDNDKLQAAIKKFMP
ncbi:MAG: tetratricopeptide repeat protein [Pseudomonadota bacterium]